MEKIFDAIAQVPILVASLVCFVIIIKTLIPSLTLNAHYSIDRLLGRGLKKYKYPTGRAVVYEPHPSVRKYLNKYILFVNDGYKYLRCRFDAGVKSVRFEVMMFSSTDKHIDTLRINAKIGADLESKNILLHHRTSYVALKIETINDHEIPVSSCGYYTAGQLSAYFFLVALSIFVESLVVANTAGSFLTAVLNRSIVLTTSTALYFIVSLFVAFVAVLFVVFSGFGRGIEVSRHEKK